MDCEICEKPSEATCSGLDVPALDFCRTHAEDHERTCPEVISGQAHVEYPED